MPIAPIALERTGKGGRKREAGLSQSARNENKRQLFWHLYYRKCVRNYNGCWSLKHYCLNTELAYILFTENCNILDDAVYVSFLRNNNDTRQLDWPLQTR